MRLTAPERGHAERQVHTVLYFTTFGAQMQDFYQKTFDKTWRIFTSVTS
jgi:hypothetical protein